MQKILPALVLMIAACGAAPEDAPAAIDRATCRYPEATTFQVGEPVPAFGWADGQTSEGVDVRVDVADAYQQKAEFAGTKALVFVAVPEW